MNDPVAGFKPEIPRLSRHPSVQDWRTRPNGFRRWFGGVAFERREICIQVLRVKQLGFLSRRTNLELGPQWSRTVYDPISIGISLQTTNLPRMTSMRFPMVHKSWRCFPLGLTCLRCSSVMQWDSLLQGDALIWWFVQTNYGRKACNGREVCKLVWTCGTAVPFIHLVTEARRMLGGWD